MLICILPIFLRLIFITSYTFSQWNKIYFKDDAFMNTSNYSRLPVTSLSWVGKTVLQDEGELHASRGKSSGPWYAATGEKSGSKTQHWSCHWLNVRPSTSQPSPFSVVENGCTSDGGQRDSIKHLQMLGGPVLLKHSLGDIVVLWKCPRTCDEDLWAQALNEMWAFYSLSCFFSFFPFFLMKDDPDLCHVSSGSHGDYSS